MWGHGMGGMWGHVGWMHTGRAVEEVGLLGEGRSEQFCCCCPCCSPLRAAAPPPHTCRVSVVAETMRSRYVLPASTVTLVWAHPAGGRWAQAAAVGRGSTLQTAWLRETCTDTPRAS